MCDIVVVLHAIAWDGGVTKCHKKYASVLDVLANVEAYIQTRVIYNILESISFEACRYTLEEGDGEWPEIAVKDMANRLTKELHKQV